MYLVMGCAWLVALLLHIDFNCIQLQNKKGGFSRVVEMPTKHISENKREATAA